MKVGCNSGRQWPRQTNCLVKHGRPMCKKVKKEYNSNEWVRKKEKGPYMARGRGSPADDGWAPIGGDGLLEAAGRRSG